MKRAGFLLLAILLCALPSASQDAATLTARLHATAAASSIDTPDMLPWHLKLDVQLFDAPGKPTERGTVEMWWASAGMSRITYTMPSYSITKLHQKDAWFQTKGLSHVSPFLDELLARVVHPMASDSEIDGATPDLRKQKFGDMELDCITLNQPTKNGAPPPSGSCPTFCLDPDKNSLRIITEAGSLHFVRNHVGNFRGRVVAVDVTGDVHGTEIVSGHVSALTTMKPADEDFVPGPDMEPAAAKPIRMVAGFIAGHVISHADPKYPIRARDNHVSGDVILHAAIGQDGRIESIDLVSSPDPDLSAAAITAFKQWTYAPHMLNGEPMSFQTIVTIHFSVQTSTPPGSLQPGVPPGDLRPQHP